MRVQFLSDPLRLALEANVERRLKTFIQDVESEPVALFSPESRKASSGGDWYGEHVGKWLVAASKCVARTGDADLAASVEAVVNALASWQEPDGYLGTYAPGSPARFTSPVAGSHRTWDLWVHAWMILGLLEVGLPAADAVAERIGRLVLRSFGNERHFIEQGNHAGLSSLVMIGPLARLAVRTGDLSFAEFALDQAVYADQNGLKLLSAEAGADVSVIGTGKIYQLLWCMVGLLEVGEALREAAPMAAVQNLYEDVRANHLSPLGGPWGGVATHNEVFNRRGFFSPGGLVETCSSTTWLDLSNRLFRLTGNLQYAAEAEKTLLNSILGAQDANGEDWCYFTFANGRRNNTYHWACCKSSGALALELAAESLLHVRENQVAINLLESFECTLVDGQVLRAEISEGKAVFSSDQAVALEVRVPGWAEVTDGRVVDGKMQFVLTPGQPTTIDFTVKTGVHGQKHSVDHHGQEIVCDEYACFTYGPYVLASGPDGDIHTPPTLRLSKLFPLNALQATAELSELRLPGCKPLRLEPYYRAGGRHDGAWRNSWFPVAWQ